MKCPLCGLELYKLDELENSEEYLCQRKPLSHKDEYEPFLYHYRYRKDETDLVIHEKFRIEHYEVNIRSNSNEFRIFIYERSGTYVFYLPRFEFSSEEHLLKRLKTLLVFS